MGSPGVYEGAANVIAALMLLVEFGMLRQALVRDQVRLYAAQSALISVLAIVVPLVLRRLLGRRIEDDAPGIAGSYTLSPASAVLAAIGLAAFGFFCFGSLGFHSSQAPVTALALAAAMIFVAFGLMVVRRDVFSQAIGFFSLENAISLASLVVAAELPLLLETVFLFDLLLAVVVFGMLIRVHQARSESLSTADLTQLRG
jgi:hydrogenase-4 component E